jgi:hypothetical protein
VQFVVKNTRKKNPFEESTFEVANLAQGIGLSYPLAVVQKLVLSKSNPRRL